MASNQLLILIPPISNVTALSCGKLVINNIMQICSKTECILRCGVQSHSYMSPEVSSVPLIQEGCYTNISPYFHTGVKKWENPLNSCNWCNFSHILTVMSDITITGLSGFTSNIVNKPVVEHEIIWQTSIYLIWLLVCQWLIFPECPRILARKERGKYKVKKWKIDKCLQLLYIFLVAY